MTAVMTGVRILEVAEHTFVPAASGLLSNWGAEVIKIEPVERGDAVLLAWAADYSLVNPMNRFSARRSRHDTLLRVAAEVKNDQ